MSDHGQHLVLVDRIDCCSGDRCFCPASWTTRPDARQPFPARAVSPERSTRAEREQAQQVRYWPTAKAYEALDRASDAQVLTLARTALAEPECDHPRCGDGVHWATTRDPETGAYDEEGCCPLLEVSR